jgi:uncharacterized protein YfaS (alpha-2-macroglobulin family)
MKRIKFPIVFFVVCLILSALAACGPTKPKIIEIDPGFGEYISGYTSGMVGREDVIRIELSESLPEDMVLTKEQKQDLVEVEPAVEGKVSFFGDRVIEFVPTKPLDAGQFYTVSLKLDELADVKSGFETFQFQFATHDQKIDVDLYGLRNYSTYEIKYQRLEGAISTTDFEDSTLLRKSINVTLDGDEIPFRFTRRYGNQWRFVADSIERTEREQKIIVRWNGEPIKSISKGEKMLKVPSLGDFTVTSFEVKEQDDQVIEMRFSDPIKYDQNLKGIVSIKGIENLTYSIDYNAVRVYLPNRFVGAYELKVDDGIRNIAGAQMNEPYSRSLILHEPFPQVKLVGSGSILPNSQGLIFPFEAVALKAVDVRVIRIHEKNVHNFLQVNNLDGDDQLTRFGTIVAEKKVRLDKDKSKNLKQWNTHIINLENLIKAEPGAIYQVALKFNKSYTLCDCNDDIEEKELEPSLKDGWNEYYWHRYGYNGYSTWGYYDDGESPCDNNYYYGRAVKRNILASNIGMVFKLDTDKHATAILSDMTTTTPLKNAMVSYYDYTNQLIASGTTNSQGMMKVKLNRKPFLMIAKKGSQRGYLKLTDGHVNSLSKFDVQGQKAKSGIKGFIYAERGVWRPGDSIYVNFMLQDKNKTLPSGHPVNFELKDPNGNIIYEVSTSKNLNGVYDFRTLTSISAPTGSYQAKVVVGDQSYYKYLKVETVKPNRLKIYLDAKKANSGDSSTIQAKWLHGASAKGLKAKVEVRMTPMRTTFKGYKGFVFDSPIRNGASANRTVFSGILDKNGEARFRSKTSDIKEAAGKLKAHYFTKVYEKGGDFSVDRKVASYSPYSTYVGIECPKRSIYDNTLVTDKKHRFNLVTVNDGGKLQKNRRLNVKIYKVSWNWWYDGHEDLASFTARQGTILVKDTNIVNANGRAQFEYKVKRHEYGKYLIIVTDPKGKHQTGQLIHFDWPYWSRANRSESTNAAMLTFATDKKKYNKGEMVRMSFPSPSEGRALVSVETSERVIKKFWIETKKGETTHEFLTTADMAPNAYIHVTLIQPHHSTKNDLPIRMYGVMPIEVDDPFTHLSPIISMKDEIRPESTVNIKVREKQGRKMTYTLAIVDDGLLDLTGFNTPQPWNTFYAKEALGVKTWDMYDDVIGAFSGKLDHLLSVGGDGSAVVGNGPKANRFKPMVRYIGPFELVPGASKNHKIDIPNYVGSVRVMVVARDQESYGNASKTVVVKKPLMVLATLPRVLGPGEEINLPVNVFAMEKHVKNVKVKIEANGMFEVIDAKSKSIQFKKEGDEIVGFKLKTKQSMGIGKVKIVATSGNEVARQEIEIDIRPSNPFTYETEEFQLEAGKSINTKVLFDGIKGSQSASIEVSTLPAIGLEKRLGYLVHYPHGCVEQTTSSVFPQLYLSSLMELSTSKKREIETNVKAGLVRLQLFQTYEGGFAYWPGESSESEWGTNYAGHFILEAEKLGYKLPTGMKRKWIAYQAEQAKNWTPISSWYSRYNKSSQQHTQAYRLYLLALCGKPEIGAMNRLREDKDLSTIAKWRLAGAYAQIGQKETATKLTQGMSTSVSRYRELSYTFGSSFRDKAVILETQSALGMNKKAFESMKSVADILGSSRWLSTQETAYGLLSIAKYCKATGNGSSSRLSYAINGGSIKYANIGRKVNSIGIKERGSIKRSIKLSNSGDVMLFVTVVTKKIPKSGNEKDKSSNLQMKVVYKDMDGKYIQPNKLKQGTEFVAVVQLTNTSKRDYREMALNQIFPSGWEIHNSRLYGSKGYSSRIRYQDYRDDRVLSYYSLKAGETKTIKVLLNATYTGKFYLPAVYSEAMYDHSIHAQKKGKWVIVE